MKWQEVRQLCPHRWVVVEAINAYTDGARRVVDEINLVGSFGEDWHEAWEFYKKVHHENKYREYYYLHTDREELDIEVADIFRRTIQE